MTATTWGHVGMAESRQDPALLAACATRQGLDLRKAA